MIFWFFFQLNTFLALNKLKSLVDMQVPADFTICTFSKPIQWKSAHIYILLKVQSGNRLPAKVPKLFISCAHKRDGIKANFSVHLIYWRFIKIIETGEWSRDCARFAHISRSKMSGKIIWSGCITKHRPRGKSHQVLLHFHLCHP